MTVNPIPGRDEAKAFAAAFSAVVFALFLTNLGFEQRSNNAEWGLWALSVSVCVLSVWWLSLHMFREDEWKSPQHWGIAILVSTGYGSGFIGMVLTVANVNEMAADVLIVTTFLGLVLLSFAVSPKQEPPS